MKTGIIVYITGEASFSDDYNLSRLTEQLSLDADRVEIISHDTGHFDVSDAWYNLTVNGMQRIVCKMAEFTGLGEIRLTGRELRLCG